MPRPTAAILICLFLTGASPPPPKNTPTPKQDDSPLAHAEAAYGRLLRSIVTPDGLVRYKLLAQGPFRRQLAQTVEAYATLEPPKEKNDRLACWINAYNINVLALLMPEVEREGFKTVRDVAGFFDRTTITVAGETLTLNKLQEERLRPLKEPRIHAAVVCGAMSCPPLRAEPFTAARLDEQLDDQCRRFVNDPQKNCAIDGKPHLSRIFEWYEEDFRVQPYGDRLGFVRHFAREDGSGGELRRALQKPAEGEIQIEWLEYNWRLNRSPADKPSVK